MRSCCRCSYVSQRLHLSRLPSSSSLTSPRPVLTPFDITVLQLVSKKLRSICLDDKFWRQRCFDESLFLESILRRRALGPIVFEGAGGDDVENVAHVSAAAYPNTEDGLSRANIRREQQRRTYLENWDPVFPDETVSWYDEYIHRFAPITMNWFQQPMLEAGKFQDVDVRGVALYIPSQGPRESASDGLLAVSPLDNGSVCLWDVNGSRKRRGEIIAQSQPNILFIDGPGTKETRRSKMVDTGVTECIAVDNWANRAFIAVQNRAYVSAKSWWWFSDLQQI
jgi:hypothetical protein